MLLQRRDTVKTHPQRSRVAIPNHAAKHPLVQWPRLDVAIYIIYVYMYIYPLQKSLYRVPNVYHNSLPYITKRQGSADHGLTYFGASPRYHESLDLVSGPIVYLLTFIYSSAED